MTSKKARTARTARATPSVQQREALTVTQRMADDVLAQLSHPRGHLTSTVYPETYSVFRDTDVNAMRTAMRHICGVLAT